MQRDPSAIALLRVLSDVTTVTRNGTRHCSDGRGNLRQRDATVRGHRNRKGCRRCSVAVNDRGGHALQPDRGFLAVVGKLFTSDRVELGL